MLAAEAGELTPDRAADAAIARMRLVLRDAVVVE
jgi:hypothetical protein